MSAKQLALAIVLVAFGAQSAYVTFQHGTELIDLLFANSATILLSVDLVIALSLMTSPFWLYTARRVEGLAGRRIATLRQLLDGMYGKEARAVVVVGQHTVNFSIRVGEHETRRPGGIFIGLGIEADTPCSKFALDFA